MRHLVSWRLIAAMLVWLVSTGTVQAAEGWERTRWGMSPAEVSRLYPSVRPVAAERRSFCIDRVESLEREGIVEAGGRTWSARFCFGPRGDRLRSVYLAAEGSAPDFSAMASSLTVQHGTPLPQAADGTLPDLQQWRDGATLIRLDGTSRNGVWDLAYQSARPWPDGGLHPGTLAAAKPVGRWVYIAPSEGSSGAKFGWVDPSLPNHFSGLALICREGGLRPGEVAVTTPVGTTRAKQIEVRIDDGVRTVAVVGRPDMNDDALWALLPGSHPVFGLLAETRETRMLTLASRTLAQPQRYSLTGVTEPYRQFAQACGLQQPPAP